MRAIGIDGGGSHTRFVLYDEESGILNGFYIEIPGNYHLLGLERLKKVFKEGLKKVAEDRHFDVLGAGLSGVDRPYDIGLISEIFRDLGIEDVVISNDAVAALWGAVGGIGALMVSGTGSIVIGRNAEGNICRAGGWGYMFEEYCGGFWLVKRGTMAILDFKDGLGPPTTLEKEMLDFLGIKDTEGIIYNYYSDFSKSKISSAARVVLREAEKGDEVSRNIVKEGIDGALKMISVVANRCNFGEYFTFSYTGGIFNSKYFLKEMEGAFKRTFPNASFVKPRFDADVGAAMMAIDWRRNNRGKIIWDV